MLVREVLQPGKDPQSLPVAFEAANAPHAVVQRHFATAPEGRMPKVVAEARCLDEA